MPDLNISPEVSVIMVSYNTRELTLRAIDSVLRKTNINYELIVIDNASNDGSAASIAANFPDIQVINSDQNLGFAAANNLAASHATGDYILLLNPDTEILDAAIDKLLAFAKEKPECRIWGGRTLFADMRLNPSSCWMRQTFWSLFCQAIGVNSILRSSTVFNPEGIGGWDREGERDVDIVSGCFFLTTTEHWREMNGFKFEYFMYGEEADFCLRSISNGARPRVTSKATIIHLGGASEKVAADKLVRLLSAKSLLINDHFSKAKIIARFLLGLWPLSRYFVHSLLARLGKFESIDRAKIWGEVWRRRTEWA